MVRNKIKMFAQKKVTLPPGRHKVVILDEADRFAAGHPCSKSPRLSISTAQAIRVGLYTRGAEYHVATPFS